MCTFTKVEHQRKCARPSQEISVIPQKIVFLNSGKYRTDLSPPHEASLLPEHDHATHHTRSVCPSRSATRRRLISWKLFFFKMKEKEKKKKTKTGARALSNPVYARSVDSSALVFSLSSHRLSYIGLVFSSRFID